MVKPDASQAVAVILDAFMGMVRAEIAAIQPSSASPEPEVLTREEAAELLRISVPSLMGHVERDALPAHRVGVQWRFRRSEILQWLGSRGTDVKLLAVKG